METCSHCGGTLPENATFCPSCGRRTDAQPESTRDVPIDVQHAEPRYFGLAPPMLVLVAELGLFLLGIVLLVTGSFAVGVIAIVAAFCLLPTFVAGARRWPDTPIARVGLSAADRVRDEAGQAADSISIWSRTSRDVARLRKEQFRLRRARDAKIRELGVSYYEDDGRAEELKAEAKELDGQIESNDRTLGRTLAGARRRVRRGRAAVVATEVIPPEEPSDTDEPLSREVEAPTEAAPKPETRSR